MKDYQFIIPLRKAHAYHLSDIGENMMISVHNSYWIKSWNLLIYDKVTQIATVAIEKGGHINGFPGIVEKDLWKNEYVGNGYYDYANYDINYERFKDGRALIIYTLQPDGQYWADEDGFGAEKDVELNFYSYVNRCGEFTQPFEIYHMVQVFRL